MYKNFIALPLRVVVMLGFIALSSLGSAAGDPAAGKSLYMVCSSCHGSSGEGNQSLNSPPLAGVPAWYTARQLTNFKEGVRGTNPKDVYGMQMRPMAMTLTSQKAIDDVSAYIESLK